MFSDQALVFPFLILYGIAWHGPTAAYCVSLLFLIFFLLLFSSFSMARRYD